MTNELIEQREQSNACIDSAESRQKKAEGQQIEQKKQQLKQLAEEVKALTRELVEAGVIELSEDDLDQAAGGLFPTHHGIYEIPDPIQIGKYFS